VAEAEARLDESVDVPPATGTAWGGTSLRQLQSAATTAADCGSSIAKIVGIPCSSDVGNFNGRFIACLTGVLFALTGGIAALLGCVIFHCPISAGGSVFIAFQGSRIERAW